MDIEKLDQMFNQSTSLNYRDETKETDTKAFTPLSVAGFTGHHRNSSVISSSMNKTYLSSEIYSSHGAGFQAQSPRIAELRKIKKSPF